MPQQNSPIVVVGAGIAGLVCARHLHAAGLEVQVLEGGARIGGRVRTDELEGFLLDRGFQVLLTSYPEAQRQLDLAALDLHAFEPGALIRRDGRFHALADPRRDLGRALRGLFAPIGSLTDKLRVARLQRRLLETRPRQVLAAPETSTLARLRELGMSEQIVDRFFRPFFGGVFLESELETSSRWFELLFRLFAQGRTTLPARGMEAIPRQLAATLPPEWIRTSCEVTSATADGVRMSDGTELAARAVVLALPEPSVRVLLGEEPAANGAGADCLYFAAERPPVRGPWLVLDGEGRGPINNLAVLSQVAPSYAPSGQHLLSTTVLGHQHLDERDVLEGVRLQLEEWFGSGAGGLRHLRTYRIPYGLPRQPAGRFLRPPFGARHSSGLFLAGDWLETASLQGAMVSGRKAAEAVLSSLDGAS